MNPINCSGKVKFFLFGHGGCNNHGCEAIVRTTAASIKKNIPNSSIKIASYQAESDYEFHIPGIDGYVGHETPIKKYTPGWVKSIYFNRFKKDYVSSYKVLQQEAICEALNSDICISIGGDNYCYGEPLQFYAMNQAIKSAGKKLVLWGASIEPDCIDQRMIKDLRLFDALFIRESITFNMLKEKNINRNMFLYPDPAFAMEKEELPLPQGWRVGKMIGLNLSPLIMDYEKKHGITIKSFFNLLNYIIWNTEYNIVLIPHVVSENNNDYVVLKKLFEHFKESKRILLLGSNYSAPQLKGFISRCSFFIGARTHATIAAYSTCVPTLVLGYSVKARGIARDIFGDEKNFVIPIQSLTDSEQLINGLNFLFERESFIRRHLHKFIPEYTYLAESAICELIEITESERDWMYIYEN